MRLWWDGVPDSVRDEIASAGLDLVLTHEPPLDAAHIFVTQRAVLDAELPLLLAVLAPSGLIWVSWPKKAAKVATDITEDSIREVALPLGLVDVKVCAVDAVWSGLKLMRRRAR